MSTISYQDEDALEFLNEMETLFPLHYEELCVTKDYPLEPDYETYRWMWGRGRLRTITCRLDGELIGYVVFFVYPHPHYKSCVTAFEDIYFVHKDHRRGRVGIKLFTYAEKVLRALKVNRIVMHTKVHSDNSSLFEYLGYKQTDKVFTKML
jgi:GNAT superfamily N-acetyltransferase